MTAMHGEGSWEPEPIAKSLSALAIALRAIKDISVGREHPVALEQNPLSDSERLPHGATVYGVGRHAAGSGKWARPRRGAAVHRIDIEAAVHAAVLPPSAVPSHIGCTGPAKCHRVASARG